MSEPWTFADRRAAGQALARVLAGRRFTAPVVLALPRGGVPVAAEIARILRAPMDLVFVRKIGVPHQPELAAAAVVDGGNPEIVTNERRDRAERRHAQLSRRSGKARDRRDRAPARGLPPRPAACPARGPLADPR